MFGCKQCKYIQVQITAYFSLKYLLISYIDVGTLLLYSVILTKVCFNTIQFYCVMIVPDDGEYQKAETCRSSKFMQSSWVISS